MKNLLEKKLLFVSGKGGVGKTIVSHVLARTAAKAGKKTLHVTFEDPAQPQGVITHLNHIHPNLWHLNCEAGIAFEEYVGLKIGIPSLTRVFLKNKVVRYLAKAAPGIHELVLLGKVWFERIHYDIIIADMPSTGYGLAMFHSTANFAKLFKGGPIHTDAMAMIQTFSDPTQTCNLIVSLPEEMPLRESVELKDFLNQIFPNNLPQFLINRKWPKAPSKTDHTEPALLFLSARSQLEESNLSIWNEAGIQYWEFPFVIPAQGNSAETVIEQLTLHAGKLLHA